MAQKIMKTKAFQSIRTELIPYKKCTDKYKFNSDSYWDCYIREVGGSAFYHFAGTCRMGFGKKDPNSVVDSKLR